MKTKKLLWLLEEFIHVYINEIILYLYIYDIMNY